MARSFNGTNQQLASGTGLTIPFDGSNGPFTFAFWFRATSNAQSNTYIFTFTDAGGGNQTSIIYEYVNDAVEFYTTAGGASPRTGSQIAVADTSWHHVAYRKSASGASEWAYFLDGTKTVINASINFTLPTGTDRLCMGSAGGSNHCACELADVATWDSSVSDADMAAMAKGFSSRFYRPLFSWDLIGRNSPETPYRGSIELTVTGAANAAHPRIIYPRRKQVAFAPAAAAASAVGHYYRNHLMARRRA